MVAEVNAGTCHPARVEILPTRDSQETVRLHQLTAGYGRRVLAGTWGSLDAPNGEDRSPRRLILAAEAG